MTDSVDLSCDPRMIDLRKSIDLLDVSFIHLLAERMRIVKKIMWIKQTEKIELERSEARKEDMRNLIEMSVQLRLEKTFFPKILDLVFEEAQTQFGGNHDAAVNAEMDRLCQNLSLSELRRSLLHLDSMLCYLLAERFGMVKRIGVYKRALGIEAFDPVRWNQLLAHKVRIAESLGISAVLIEEIFTAIHEVSLNIENEIGDAT